MSQAHFGYHLMLDCKGCNPNVQNYNKIRDFVKTLVKKIDMVAVGEPIIEYLCEGDPKEGYSLMQLISTSSIVGHFINSGEAYFDVFSCKPFEIKDAESVVREFFEPEKVRINYITRHAD